MFNDEFKKRSGLWNQRLKPKGDIKPTTDLPLFLGDKEKHEQQQTGSQQDLFEGGQDATQRNHSNSSDLTYPLLSRNRTK